MNIAIPSTATTVHSIQTIARREPVLQRAGAGVIDRTARSIARLKSRAGCLAMRPHTVIMHCSTLWHHTHVCVVIWQAIPEARRTHREQTRSIEAEDPHATTARCFDVGAHVDLREGREGREDREITRTYASHTKWHDTEPGPTIEGVQFQHRRNERAQGLRTHRPVHEQQIMPAHGHDPGALRQGPWAVERLMYHRFGGSAFREAHEVLPVGVSHQVPARISAKCPFSESSGATGACPVCTA